jgi:hypothetical protein
MTRRLLPRRAILLGFALLLLAGILSGVSRMNYQLPSCNASCIHEL